MKTVELEKTTLTASALASLAKNGTVILTRKGKPLVSVKDLSGSDWESISLANNPRFLALIEESRRSYRQHGGISLAEIRRELGLTRKARQPKSKSRKRDGTDNG
jgi:hypothetical protein